MGDLISRFPLKRYKLRDIMSVLPPDDYGNEGSNKLQWIDVTKSTAEMDKSLRLLEEAYWIRDDVFFFF